MIGISKLYCGTVEVSDPLRYGRHSARLPSHLLQFSTDKKPVVVWNCTRRCNLRCIHCYTASNPGCGDQELSTDQGKAMLDDLGEFGVPVILFSGGEPLLRPDILELIAHARNAGMRAVLSSNGTLITPDLANELANAGLSYVGISLDGLADVHNRFRQADDAFDKAFEGISHCQAVGVKVGLRLTMTASNVHQIPAIFELIESRNLPRVCFYHLVASGRGKNLADVSLSHRQTRDTIDEIIRQTARLHSMGKPVEVLTVDNHADGPYLYLQLEMNDPQRAANCLKLLEMNGGNSTGIGIGCVSWNGDVHPDQFWRQHVLGNVQQTPFSQIWSDSQQPMLNDLRNRKQLLHGRCTRCRWLGVCNGNFRARAEAANGDMWADDPACYLTDEEIA